MFLGGSSVCCEEAVYSKVYAKEAGSLCVLRVSSYEIGHLNEDLKEHTDSLDPAFCNVVKN